MSLLTCRLGVNPLTPAPEPFSQLQREVYDHLCHLAHNQLRGQSRKETLNTHVLVHETFLKLFANGERPFNDEEHFFATAATAMRQIIIDYARKKATKRRGGNELKMTLDPTEPGDVAVEQKADALLSLNDALTKLGALDPRLEQVIELRFFGGMTIAEISRILGISEPTVKRDCRTARAFLAQAVEP